MTDDKDLKLLLAEYKNINPTPQQIHKWKIKVKNEVQSSFFATRKPSYVWAQLFVASIMGFIVGALVFGTSDNRSSYVNNLEENATIEYVFNNSN